MRRQPRLFPPSRRGAGFAAALLAVGCTPPDGASSASADVGHHQWRLCPDRPDARAHYADDDVVRTHDSDEGSFRIHFTTTEGSDSAIPVDDEDENGVPDRAERVADAFDEALAFYLDLGYRAPPSDEAELECNGGDGRFDIYLLALPPGVNGFFQPEEGCGPSPETCTGFILLAQTPSASAFPSVEIAIRTLASHELFHAIQAAYDATEDAVGNEGTAVWASELFDPSLDDLETFVGRYLDEPERSLDDDSPPIVGFPYGAALFFRFLEETEGADLILDMWTRAEGEDRWLEALVDALSDRGGRFDDSFGRFAEWNLLTGSRASADRAYRDGAAYPELTLPPPSGDPIEELVLDVRHASTRYLVLDTEGRDQVAVELRIPDGRATSLASLRPFVALVDADGGIRPGAPLRDVAEDRRELTVDVGDAAAAILAIPNGRERPPSLQPLVCFGSPEEVAACVDRLDPDRTPPDAGPPSTDAGPPDGRAGGGCAVVRGTPTGANPLLAVLAVAFTVSPWRRRRAQRREDSSPS